MWHLIKHRIRKGRKGGTKESENVVRECKAFAKEELWSGWNPVEKQVQKINQEDRKKPKCGLLCLALWWHLVILKCALRSGVCLNGEKRAMCIFRVAVFGAPER